MSTMANEYWMFWQKGNATITSVIGKLIDIYLNEIIILSRIFILNYVEFSFSSVKI